MSPPASLRASFGRLSVVARANLLALGGFAFLYGWQLWPQWLHNPDLAHGLALPALFLVLLRESRQSGTQRFVRPGAAAAIAVAALGAAGLALLSAAGLYAAAVEWYNSLVEFLLASSLALLLGAALLTLADERVRVLPFNWNACAAIALWPLAAPIPSGTYMRLTLALQLWISTGVMDALQLLGIAAHRQGNIIELATCRVGVEEACSGVRSLISCVFVGLFFSASLVRRPASRVLVIGVAAPLALAMNFLRALALTLLANAGVSISGFWHDTTGYAVLLITAALLAGLALGLEGRAQPAEPAPALPVPAPPRPVAGPAVLGAALAAAAALTILFVLNTHPIVRSHAPVPDLAALMPAAPPGWSAGSSADLTPFESLLRTDVLQQRTYLTGTGSQAVLITCYVAYWRPGQVPISAVDQHTPDACWPGAGWSLQAVLPTVRMTFSGHTLAPPEARLFTNSGVPRYVWFWHLYAGSSLRYHDPYSAIELLRLAWHFGFRHNGDQLFVSVSSNQPWSRIAGEPVVRDFFARLKPLGL